MKIRILRLLLLVTIILGWNSSSYIQSASAASPGGSSLPTALPTVGICNGQVGVAIPLSDKLPFETSLNDDGTLSNVSSPLIKQYGEDFEHPTNISEQAQHLAFPIINVGMTVAVTGYYGVMKGSTMVVEGLLPAAAPITGLVTDQVFAQFATTVQCTMDNMTELTSQLTQAVNNGQSVQLDGTSPYSMGMTLAANGFSQLQQLQQKMDADYADAQEKLQQTNKAVAADLEKIAADGQQKVIDNQQAWQDYLDKTQQETQKKIQEQRERQKSNWEATLEKIRNKYKK